VVKVHHTEVNDYCNLLMNFWSCKLANLPNQKSFSCADNGGVAYLY